MKHLLSRLLLICALVSASFGSVAYAQNTTLTQELNNRGITLSAIQAAKTAADQAKAAADVLAAQRPTTTQIIGSREGALGGQAATNVSDGSVASATYRNWHVSPPYPVSDLVLAFANWRMTPNGIVLGANAITTKATIETASGAVYPVFCGGQQTVTIQPGATLWCDAVGFAPPPSTNYWTRVYVTNAGVTNGTWPLGRTVAANGLESSTYNTTAADLTGSSGQIAGSTVSGLGSFSFGPVAILGTGPADKVTYTIYGDSISTGVGDNGSQTMGYYGGIERALSGNYAWNTITRAGFRGQQMLAAPSQAMALARGRVVLDEMGVNDIYAGNPTLAVLQANKLVEWAAFSARGAKVWQTTITPYTTSTDGWTTLAGQALFSPALNPVRTGFNDWLRAGAPTVNGVAVAAGTNGALLAGQVGHPLAGYLEVADLIESSRNSGLFRVTSAARSVSDAQIASGTNSLTSASASFTSADVGTTVWISNGTNTMISTITAVPNSTTASLYSQATVSFSGATAKVGGYTVDGLHWGPIGHEAVRQLIQTQLTAGRLSLASPLHVPASNDNARQAQAA